MSTVALTEETFRSYVQKPGIVFIDFWAPWCPPCRAFAPIFEAAAKENTGIVWAKVDTQAEPQLAGSLNIRSIPTLMVFRDGILLFSQAGILPAAALNELARKVGALDMNEIRAALSKARGQKVA